MCVGYVLTDMYGGYGGAASSMMPHQPVQHHPAPASDMQQPQQPQSAPRRHALDIVDPNTGKNVLIGSGGGAGTEHTSTDQPLTASVASTSATSVISSESYRVICQLLFC